MIRLAQCVTYGHIGGAENYWHCKCLDFVRAISYGAGIAVQPVQNNIVDTVALAQKGFKVDPSKLDGQMTKYNGIDQNTIGYLDLSEVVASDNLKTNAIPKNVFRIFSRVFAGRLS